MSNKAIEVHEYTLESSDKFGDYYNCEECGRFVAVRWENEQIRITELIPGDVSVSHSGGNLSIKVDMKNE